MDALPELLADTVGDAAVIDTVEIGGGDAVAVTHTATHVYRSDGLLSDESIETFEHDVERLSVRTKRRKSEIRLETIDSETSFTVPSKVVEPIVEAMIEGVLRTTDVIGNDETVVAQFRFSELTLVVTDERLFEHVGSAVWDEDFEAVRYADLTGLAFEKGSVATQVVLETANRRRRVKVPNEHAGRVRREIQDAVFGFHDVSSSEELRAKLSNDVDDSENGGEDVVKQGANDELETGDDVRPETVPNEPGSESESDPNEPADSFVSADWSPPADQDVTGGATERPDGAERAEPPEAGAFDPIEEPPGEPSTDPDIDALAERVETLSQRIDRQTELIESQGELIEQLVDELRRGR